MVAGDRGDLPTLGLGAAGLGVAFMGMLPSIRAHPVVKLVAAADPRKDGREKIAQEFGAATYERFEDLCRDPKVDIVYIATPHQFHTEQAIMAARHGKHLLVEKPLALSIEDCQAILRAVEQAGVKLIVGHTNSYDPPIAKARAIVRSGELGRLRMMLTFNYTEYLYRPRRPEELDTSQGGGILFNQTPHQVDMIRLIGGGLVRSVRAYAGVWDPARPTEAASAAFLDFEDGTVATVVYNGYAHFDAEEFWGQPPRPETYGALRKALRGVGSPAEETALRYSTGYGSPRQRDWNPSPNEHERFGMIIVSCDKGDIRPSLDGVIVYGDEEVRTIPVPFGRGGTRRATVLDEIYDAVVTGKPLIHDGRWGMATLEVCLAILQSARERREVFLSHQVPTRDR